MVILPSKITLEPHFDLPRFRWSLFGAIYSITKIHSGQISYLKVSLSNGFMPNLSQQLCVIIIHYYHVFQLHFYQSTSPFAAYVMTNINL